MDIYIQFLVICLLDVMDGLVDEGFCFLHALEVVVQDRQVHVQQGHPTFVGMVGCGMEGFVVVIDGRIILILPTVEQSQVAVDADGGFRVAGLWQVGDDLLLQLHAALVIALIDV